MQEKTTMQNPVTWRNNLKEELKKDKTAIIINLIIYTTKNNEIRGAVKKITKEWGQKTNKKIKYWLITEPNIKNNSTKIHGIVWNTTRQELTEIWNKGEININKYVNNKTIEYLMKYIGLNQDTQIMTRNIK